MRKSMLHGIELESLDPGVKAINPWKIFKYSDNLTKAKHAQLHTEKGNANLCIFQSKWLSEHATVWKCDKCYRFR